MAEAWDNIDQMAVGAPDQFVRDVHRSASTMLLPVALAAAAATVGWAVRARRRTWMAGVLLVVLVAAGGVTGYLIAWDQVALRAVTVGTNVNGVWWVAFDDGVRFVIIDGTEVSQTSYRNAVGAHLLVTGAIVAAIVAVWRSLGRRSRG